jgi:hypothetical protein
MISRPVVMFDSYASLIYDGSVRKPWFSVAATCRALLGAAICIMDQHRLVAGNHIVRVQVIHRQVVYCLERNGVGRDTVYVGEYAVVSQEFIAEVKVLGVDPSAPRRNPGEEKVSGPFVSIPKKGPDTFSSPVVGHEAITDQPHAGNMLERLPENALKGLVVAVFVEDRRPPIAPVEDMVRITARRTPQGPSHDAEC